MVARQKENPSHGKDDADRPPLESDATPTLTDWTDEAGQ